MLLHKFMRLIFYLKTARTLNNLVKKRIYNIELKIRLKNI